MREWTDAEYAQAAIDMLPGTVEEIREFFISQGVTGQRGHINKCPIANWLERWTGNPISVGDGTWRRADCGDRTYLPDIVQKFVIAFDQGSVSL